MATADAPDALYVGVDVGGDEILAGVVDPRGEVRARRRLSTPREGGGAAILASIGEAIAGALRAADIQAGRVGRIGIGLPGVIDSAAGVLVVAPNMPLQGPVAAAVSEQFGVPVVLGNDCNVALLAEQRFGAAREARHAIGLFVGTGLGGGIICNNQLLDGSHGAAAEVGHIIMEIDGPLCGCGNRGCLEALASRTAIERDLREAVGAGRETLLTAAGSGSLDVIKSGALRRCLEAKDPLVTEVIGKAARTLGLACISLQHLLDPELIVFGGGVIEACGSFMLPVIRETLSADPFLGSRAGGRVVEAELGDDAGLLGAAALAQIASGGDPRGGGRKAARQNPTLEAPQPGEILVSGSSYTGDVYIRADGKVRKRKRSALEEAGCDRHQVCAAELEWVLGGDPELLVIGSGHDSRMRLTPEAESLLKDRGVRCVTAPTREAALLFNQASGRKAALLHGSL